VYFEIWSHDLFARDPLDFCLLSSLSSRNEPLVSG
jgi:hypothetical protein